MAHRRTSFAALVTFFATATWFIVAQTFGYAASASQGFIVIAALIAGVSCFSAARTRGGHRALGLRLLGGASFLSAVGRTIAAFDFRPAFEARIFTAWTTAGFLLMMVVGMLLAIPRTARPQRVPSYLDGIVAGLSVLFVGWIVLVAPLLDQQHRSSTLVAFALADIALVALSFVVIGMAPLNERTPASLMGAAAVVVAIAHGSMIVDGQAYPIGPLPVLGWTIGFLVLATASSWRDEATNPHPRAADTGIRSFGLPYAALAIALTVAGIEQTVAGSLSTPLFWIAFLQVGVVLLRVVLSQRENLRLTQALKHLVRKGTDELTARQLRFRSLIQNSSDLITVIGSAGTIRSQNGPLQRMLGVEDDALVNTRFDALLHPDDRGSLWIAVEQIVATPSAQVVADALMRRADGTWFRTESILTNLLSDPTVEGIVLNTRDVSERHALEAQLLHQSFHDPLTGLGNRVQFQDRIEHALLRAKRNVPRPAVIVMDVDRFKQVNDTYGVAAGDRLLIAIAGRLSENVRPSDSLARLGSDEFGVLVDHESGENEARRVALRISESVHQPFIVEGRSIRIRVRIGAAIGRPGQTDGAELLGEAHLALERAREMDAEPVAMFNADLQRHMMERLEIEAELKDALERDEFALHYQPIVDLATGRVRSVEALCRWNHPTKGQIPPDVFIPIAEESDEINALGKWTIETACRDIAAWRRRGINIPRVAVNLSPRQLLNPALTSIVHRALDDNDLPTATLVLELTESSLVENSRITLERLHALKDLGVLLAIDDFGTGYSALSYMSAFPVDILKIDRSFVKDMGAEPETSAVVRAILKLARTFGMTTVAEGIETEAQAHLLRTLGCVAGQGFLFSAAVPAEQVSELPEAAVTWAR